MLCRSIIFMRLILTSNKVVTLFDESRDRDSRYWRYAPFDCRGVFLRSFRYLEHARAVR